MKRVYVTLAIIAAAAAGVSGYFLRGAAAQTATPAATAAAIAPFEAQAKERLDKSPRHGEWVEVKMPNAEKPLKCFVVYPERADKAPVVLVIMEIFGMTDWV